MASRHIDKLVRSFLSETSSISNRGPGSFDQFRDVQDPTYMSFKVDFFPDMGNSVQNDAYSAGGLFRRGTENNSPNQYAFYDSAADYLRRIGAPTRQAYLELFIDLLYNLQENAPWYFQSITGLADVWKLDPADNHRGRDKVLTFECLESLDLRMTLLSDLYRNVAFDFEGMREVLPKNLRTFNVEIHVLEFRKFNTTYGLIAEGLTDFTFGLDQKHKEEVSSAVRNVYGQSGNTQLFQGTLDNIETLGNNFNNAFGGVLRPNYSDNLGISSGQSKFEAISVQTFSLKNCEFDFYSEAPSYLDTVSVKDMPEATNRFKIKVGRVEKVSNYSFDRYVISEFTKNSHIPYSTIKVNSNLGRVLPNYSPAYFEEFDSNSSSMGPKPRDYFSSKEERAFPNVESLTDARQRIEKDSSELRRKPLERALGGIVRNSITGINREINEGLGQLTGGLVGTAPLGNIYSNPAAYRFAVELLNDFLTPGRQITSGSSSAIPPSDILKNLNMRLQSYKSSEEFLRNIYR